MEAEVAAPKPRTLKQKRGERDITLLRTSAKNEHCQYPHFRLPVSRAVTEQCAVVLSHQGSSDLFQQPWEPDTPSYEVNHFTEEEMGARGG